MKLVEKFKELGSDWCNEMSYVQAEGAEELADEFAIGFASWCVITQAFGIYGYEKALEIYKNEKGL